MELKLLKGLVPAIESLKYSDEMRRIIIYKDVVAYISCSMSTG